MIGWEELTNDGAWKVYRDLDKNNWVHRADGPAEIGMNGGKDWRFNGKFIRMGGPYIISSNGSKDWNRMELL